MPRVIKKKKKELSLWGARDLDEAAEVVVERTPASGVRIQGVGFRISGSGCWVQDFGFRISSPGC